MKARDIQESEAFNIIDAAADYEMSPDDMMLDSMPVTREQITDAAKMVGEMALDVTPIVGDIKGAVELPEDMAAARQLIEQGYDEGDLMQMGLGGALGALSLAGLIPMAGAAADIAKAPVKAAVKSRLADQTDAMLDKGVAGRGRKTVDVKEAEFSGQTKQKPTPKVFHGARSMQERSQGDLSVLKKELLKQQDYYIDGNSDALFDMMSNKLVGGPDATDMQLKIEDLVDFQNRKSVVSIPFANKDGYVDVKEIKIEKDPVAKDYPNSKPVYFIREYDADKGEIKDVLGVITPDVRGNISKDELTTALKSVSNNVSGISEASTPRTRAEKIKEEGFQPFSEFTGEAGLDRYSRGEHAELGERMLSTSRDPLVAMKPGFGGGDTGNVIYSDLPEEAVKDMTPSNYSTASMYRTPESLPMREAGEVGYKLPKSLHLEAEIAVTNPELLNPKLLSDNPDLAAKIQRGQNVVDSLVSVDDVADAATLGLDAGKVKNPTFNAKYGLNSVRKMDRMKAETIYKDTRKALNDLQSLGQFTEQYGARGTYDDVLETLVDGKLADNLLKAAGEFPEDSVKGNHLYGLAAVIDTMKQNLEGAGYNAAQRKFTSTRGISDEVLYDAIYKGKVKDKATLKKLEDAGIEISGDGDPLISKYDVGYNDLKRLMFLGTEKMNRGGLASRK